MELATLLYTWRKLESGFTLRKEVHDISSCTRALVMGFGGYAFGWEGWDCVIYLEVLRHGLRRLCFRWL